MVLGKLPVPRRPTSWKRVGQGPTHSPSLWEMTRYRLKYCVKRSLSPKNNQPTTNSGSSPSNLKFVSAWYLCTIFFY